MRFSIYRSWCYVFESRDFIGISTTEDHVRKRGGTVYGVPFRHGSSKYRGGRGCSHNSETEVVSSVCPIVRRERVSRCCAESTISVNKDTVGEMHGRNHVSRRFDTRMSVIMIELNCPIARSLNAEPGTTAITESPTRYTSPRTPYETHFLGLNPEVAVGGGKDCERAPPTRAVRATANLLSIKCIQQRNSG